LLSTFYVAGRAGKYQEEKMAVLSNNIANASTDGFQAHRTSFSAAVVAASHDPNRDSVVVPSSVSQHLDQTQGPIRTTRRSLDFAINGKGYFPVESGSGEKYLTRLGRFHRGLDGFIKNQEGLFLLDSSGSRVSLPAQFELTSSRHGKLRVNGNELTTLGLKDIKDTTQFKKVSGSLIKVDPKNTEDIPFGSPDSLISNMQIEGSNVNSAKAMTELVEVTRDYQRVMKVMETYSEQMKKLTERVGVNPY